MLGFLLSLGWFFLPPEQGPSVSEIMFVNEHLYCSFGVLTSFHSGRYYFRCGSVKGSPWGCGEFWFLILF